jgi:uncharacterized delta-60 repeat protein
MRRRSLYLIAHLAGSLLVSACKVYDPLYCDVEKPCEDPERPFCDLNGEYPDSDGIKKTCIPAPTVGDFAITPVDDSVQVRVGAEVAVELAIERRDGFVSEIAIVADGLPDGITAESVVVAADADVGTILVQADTAEPGSLSEVRFVATSGDLEDDATVDVLFLGSAGALDPTFGVLGVAAQPSTDGPYGPDDTKQLAQLPDGSLIVGADSTETGTGILYRFSPDGGLDTSFGIEGALAIDFDPVGVQINHHIEFEQQSDGKIVLVATGGQDIVIGRIDGDARFDTEFEGAGMFAFRVPRPVFIGDVAIGPHDEIVVGATATSSEDGIYVVRFQADGTHDRSFASGRFDLDQGDSHGFSSLHVLPDGSVAGVVTTLQADVVSPFVFKLTPQGALDPSFGDGGIHGFSPSENVVTALGLEDGAILVAGSTDGAVPPRDRDPALWRLTSEGSLDQRFGRNGKVQLVLPAGRQGEVAGLMPTTEGHVLAFGSPGISLGRLEATTGALDRSFGQDGFAIVDFDSPILATAAVRREDGRFLVLADDDSLPFFVARFFE